MRALAVGLITAAAAALPPVGASAVGARAAPAAAAATGGPLAAATGGSWAAAAAVAAARPGGLISGPSPRAGATIARIVQSVTAFHAPTVHARRVWRVPPVTGWSQEPQQLLVLRSARDRRGRLWLDLDLPIRPNGMGGWIPADYALVATTRLWIDVSTRGGVITVFARGRRVRRFRAVVGKAATPTPRGLFAIWERNPQGAPNGFLGPWALSLTALSNVLYDYGGGPGRIALHGRGGLSLLDPLGSARSHGCIRVPNRDVTWLAHHAPPGTPVRIT